MNSPLAALLAFALPLYAEDWFDPAAFRDLSRRAGAVAERVQASNGLPRLPPGSPEAQRVYNAIFPYYAEVCSGTRYNMKGQEPGGPGGHAIMFLNGAEVDPSAGYPRLRLAAGGTDLSGPDSGTGVSVNKVFANANWVAIPGRGFFFRAGLPPDRTLDQAAFEAAVRTAAGAGWFDGLRVHEELLREKPASMPLTEFIVRQSIGTDFALSFARHAYCARLPLSREAMGKVVANLNGVNEKARRGGYDWNALTNNCSHVPHNALAAAGVWEPKRTRGDGILDEVLEVLSAGKALAGHSPDLSFPANGFVRLYEAGNERPMDGAAEAFKNKDVARTMSEGWASTGPGALIVTYPMHAAGLNEVFEPGEDPSFFSLPVLWDKRRKFERLTRDPPEHLTDLGANLRRYRERYAKVLGERRDFQLDWREIDRELRETDRNRRGIIERNRREIERDRSGVGGGKERERFRAFHDRFYRHADEELRRTDSRLLEFRRLGGGGT